MEGLTRGVKIRGTDSNWERSGRFSFLFLVLACLLLLFIFIHTYVAVLFPASSTLWMQDTRDKMYPEF